MKKFSLLSAISILVLVAAGGLSLTAQRRLPEPPMRGIHWARGHQPPAGRNSSPDMTWHGGPILQTATAGAVFWGTKWSDTSFVGDKISGLDSWYNGLGGSAYGATTDEYTGTGSTQVSDSVSYQGHYIDTSAAPSHAPQTSAILNEVCKVIPTSQLVSNGYYAVYVDTPRGHTNYCAWHSAGSCGSVPVEFAFFFSLDGDPGCDPQSTITSESQGLAALANVTGHELSEARTDPSLNAWYDSSGAENADKCAWTFGGSSVTFSNRTKWKIQGNWSNYAYDHNTGYPNSGGENGCVDGTNVPGPYTR
jgi:hypothetical protein